MRFKILELCKELGINLTDLANKIGLSRVGLSKAINGNPTVDTLEKIADALNVAVWELFTESTDKSDFMALIKDGKNYYNASTVAELEKIVSTIKEKQ